MSEILLRIDGKEVHAREGMTVLEAARSLGIRVPTLCYHEALTPYGACRLCVVELVSGGRKKLAASCVYPVEEGLEVITDSPEIQKARKATMQFLLARSPDSAYLRDRAQREFGITEPRFVLAPEDCSDCILCGLCVRACAEIVGVSAIDFVMRGIKSQVEPPFLKSSDVCIGCGTCVQVCPTGYIQVEHISKIAATHEFPKIGTESISEHAIKCRVCGAYHLGPAYPKDYNQLFANVL
jgi:NADH dehydrogenase/NADH:ubiquinone oxidoreductase subunit G